MRFRAVLPCLLLLSACTLAHAAEEKKEAPKEGQKPAGLEQFKQLAVVRQLERQRPS